MSRKRLPRNVILNDKVEKDKQQTIVCRESMENMPLHEEACFLRNKSCHSQADHTAALIRKCDQDVLHPQINNVDWWEQHREQLSPRKANQCLKLIFDLKNVCQRNQPQGTKAFKACDCEPRLQEELKFLRRQMCQRGLPWWNACYPSHTFFKSYDRWCLGGACHWNMTQLSTWSIPMDHHLSYRYLDPDAHLTCVKWATDI